MVQETGGQQPPSSPLGLVVGNYCHDVLFRNGRRIGRSLGGAASFISNVLDRSLSPDRFLYLSKVGPDFAYPVPHPPLPSSSSTTTLFHAHFNDADDASDGGNRILKRISACDPIFPLDLPSDSSSSFEFEFEFGIAAAVAGEIPPETLDRLLDLCRTVLVDVQGLIRAFDPADGAVSLVPLKSTDFFRLLPRIGFLKASAEEAPFLDVEEARKWCCVIVTDGKDGCRIYWKDWEVRIPPFPAEQVDPTGAGDSFLGGFVVGLVSGLTVSDAALLGNFFGSITVGQIGIPNFDQRMLQAPLNSCSPWRRPGLLLNADDSEEPIRAGYEHWITRHGRRYKDANEKEQRFQVYRSNVQLIDNFNSLSLGFSLIDNKFADLTNEEFRAKISCLGPPQKHKHESPKGVEEMLVHNRHKRILHEKNRKDGVVPESVDWRKKGAVTSVKNQGQCGACWAFSAVAAMEGINQIKTKELVSLSEQELIDCDTADDNSGCSGGYMSMAFDFIQQNHGLTTDSDYPYQATQETCQTKKLQNHSATISGYKNVTANEQSLLEAAARQPVSVAIDAGSFAFQLYSQGVFSGPCGSDLNHGVTLVGYGTETGEKDKEGDKFWIVKNSWGPDWGEEGYIRMKRGVDSGEGLCGIAKMASYPMK